MLEKPVVIIGGGIAGLAVAGTLSDAGLKCVIVEQNLTLGGQVQNWACMATDKCQRCFCCVVDDYIRRVRASDRVEILTGRSAAVEGASAGQGFKVLLKDMSSGEETTVDAAAVAHATGFEPFKASEKVLWGHGSIEGVYTIAEVNALIRGDGLSHFTDGADKLSVAFFQCVGSRDVGICANYCSDYCCKAALRMALKLTHECTGLDATIFYIDLQAAGKYGGELVKQAENAKIRVRQGVPGEITRTSEEMLEVIVEDQGRNVRERFHRVILSIGQRPISTAEAGPFAVPVDEFGFKKAKGSFDACRTVVPGIYVAGTCAGPKDIEHTLEHAGATAAAIMTDLRTGGRR